MQTRVTLRTLNSVAPTFLSVDIHTRTASQSSSMTPPGAFIPCVMCELTGFTHDKNGEGPQSQKPQRAQMATNGHMATWLTNALPNFRTHT